MHKKRIIAILLSLCMVVSQWVPVTAAGNDDGVIAGIDDGDGNEYETIDEENHETEVFDFLSGGSEEKVESAPEENMESSSENDEEESFFDDEEVNGAENKAASGLDDNDNWSFDEETGTLTFYNQKSIDNTGAWKNDYKDWTVKVVISENVSSVPNQAFESFTRLNDIDFPDSQLTIGMRAFSGCTSLAKVKLGEGKITFAGSYYNGPRTFVNCTGLKEFDFGDTADPYKDNIYYDEGAFAGCTSLEKVRVGKGVTILGGSMFRGCTNLTTLDLSEADSLTAIGDRVFYSCGKLDGVTVPKTVTSIGNNAFDYCSALSDFSFADGSELTTIGNYAFGTNVSLETMIIPQGVTTIGEQAFGTCTNLKKIVFPQNMTTIIGKGVCYKCTSLTDVTLPEDLKALPDTTFQYCSSLASIDLDDDLASIGNNAFDGCSSLLSVSFPSNLTTLGSSSFLDCKKLQTIDFGDESHLTTIGNSAFQGCTTLEAVALPDCMNTMGNHAFNGCTSLRSFDTGDGVTTLANNALRNCSLLMNVRIGASVVTIEDEAMRGLTNLQSIDMEDADSLLTIKDNSIRDCTGLSAIALPDNLNKIGGSAFAGDTNLSSLTFNDKITTLGNNAFDGCTSLLGAEMPDSLVNIGSNAFCNCYSLKTVRLSNALAKLNTQTFYNCRSIEKLTLPDTLTELGEGALRGCTSLSDLHLSTSLVTIGYRCFRECKSLKEIVLPDSVQNIGGKAFHLCTSLESFDTGDGLSAFPDDPWDEGMFGNCESLKSVRIGKNVSSIGNYIFYNSALESVDLSEAVKLTEIRTGAFEKTKLKSVDFSDAILLTQLKDSAFRNCPDLRSVVFGNYLISIGSCAFYEDTALREIDIPGNILTIYGEAFRGCSSLRTIKGAGSVTQVMANAFYVNQVYNPSTKQYEPVQTSLDDNASNAMKNYNWTGSNRNTGIESLTFTVVYNYMHNNLVSDGVLVSEYTPLTKPEDPEWENHTFSAWYKETAYTNLWDFDDEVTGNMILYAKWDPNIIIGTPVHGTVACDVVSAPAGSEVNFSSTPDEGWELDYYTLNGYKNATPYVMGNDPVTLSAVFKKIPYELICDVVENGTVRTDKNTAGVEDVVTLSCTPADDYEIDYYTVNGEAIVGNTFAMPVGDTNVGAVFKRKHYTITIGDIYNGEVTADKATAISGEVVTLTPVPSPGYDLYSLSAGEQVLEKDVMSFNMPKRNVVVTAQFISVPHYILLDENEGGAVNILNGSSYLKYNTTVYLSNEPETGYVLDHYTVDGEPIEGDRFQMPNGNVTVGAVFRTIERTYPINLVQDNNGAIASNPRAAKINEEVKLIAYPDKDFEFVYFTVDGEPLYADTFNMPARPVQVGAVFRDTRETLYKITVNKPTGGMVSANEITATAGSEVLLDASAERGYELSYFTLNGYRMNGSTFIMPAHDVNVSAVFKPVVEPLVSHSITITRAAGGSVIALPMTATAGTVVNLIAIPDKNHELDYFTKDGEKIEEDSFTMPDADVSVSAVFKEIDTSGSTDESDEKSQVIIVSGENGNVYVKVADDKVKLLAQPLAGYALDYFTVDGEKIEGDTFAIPDRTVRVGAVFKVAEDSDKDKDKDPEPEPEPEPVVETIKKKAIKAKADSLGSLNDDLAVVPGVKASSVSAVSDNRITMIAGGKVQITNGQAGTYVSSDPNVKVNKKKGLISAKKPAKDAKIAYKNTEGKDVTLNVTVLDPAAADGIKVISGGISHGGKLKFNVTQAGVVDVALKNIPLNATIVGIDDTKMAFGGDLRMEIGNDNGNDDEAEDAYYHLVGTAKTAGNAKITFISQGKKYTIKIKVSI